GASSETISGDIEGYAPREGRANKCRRHPMLARSSEAIAVNLECRAVHNVRFWHEADMLWRTRDVGFEGVKRTWLIDRLKSAVDPNGSLAPKSGCAAQHCLLW